MMSSASSSKSGPATHRGMGNTVWAIKRFFGFANHQGCSELKVQAKLARVGPRRAPALPCLAPEETDRAALRRHRVATAEPDRLAFVMLMATYVHL
jgi:hypothetical protein